MSLYTGNNSGLMSSLFGSYKNSLFGSLSSSLSDYSMIRSGAYGKLMKAYYAKEADTMQKRLIQRRRQIRQIKQTRLKKPIRQHR